MLPLEIFQKSLLEFQLVQDVNRIDCFNIFANVLILSRHPDGQKD